MQSCIFSIIVPTFDRPDALRRTLDCIEEQQCDLSFEVIVVDDYPADVLPVLGFGNGKRETWKCIRNGANLGRAATRNRGIQAAVGRYILFLDDDIWAEPQLLQAHYERQTKIGGGAVVGSIPISGEVPHDVWNDHYRAWVGSLHQALLLHSEDLPFNLFFTGNVSVPRAALQQTGLFDEGFTGYSSEDTEMGYRLKRAGIRMVHEKSAVGHHYNVETLDSLLSKKLAWGRSAFIFARKHPELMTELSVAGILAPGNTWIQLFLTQPLLSMGKLLCRALAAAGLQPACRRLLQQVETAHYAYGLLQASRGG
jgi:GT2 family glycosyltransferase